jgi:hypothetical protein
MKMRYHFHDLSRAERERLEYVLLEEMDIQMWYAVTVCRTIGGEVFLTLQ